MLRIVEWRYCTGRQLQLFVIYIHVYSDDTVKNIIVLQYILRTNM